MKFSCTQENLHRGLQIVGHVATRNVSLPILNNVLLKAERGSLRLTATNLEIGVSCLVRAKVDQEGAFTVNGKLFADYVALLPAERIDIELEEKALVVTAPQAKTTIRGQPAEEFPLIPAVKRTKVIRLPGADLKAAITRTIFAAAADEARPEISGIFLGTHDQTLTLAATDSYRLAEQKLKLSGTIPDLRAIVPQRALQEVLRTAGDDPVEIAVEENQARFGYNDVELTTRLIEGQYPDYQQIIPRDHELTLEVTREEFVTAVKQASLFCKQGIYDVTLEVDGQRVLRIRAANAQAGEHETRLTAKMQGKPLAIVFNYRYLLDGLSSLPTETVSLELGTPASPGLLRPKGSAASLYLIMPIRQ